MKRALWLVLCALLHTGTVHARSMTGRAKPARDATDHIREAEAEWSRAEQGDPDAATHYEAAAKHWLKAWQAQGQEACREYRPICNEYGPILMRVAEAYDAAGLIGHSLRVRKFIVENEGTLAQPELVARAAIDAGHGYRRLGMIRESARLLEHGARAAPTLPQSEPALREAFELLLQLGELSQADSVAAAYREDYGHAQPEVADALVVASLERLAEQSSWSAVVARATQQLQELGERSSVHRWQVQAILARGHRALGDDGRARDLDRELIAQHQRAKAGARGRPGSDAVAESLLRRAQRAGSKVLARSMPAKGARPITIERWVRSQVKQMVEVAHQFDAIESVQPSPRWRIVAALQRAESWAALHAMVSTVVGPTGSESVAHVEARKGYRACLDLARRLAYVDADARACERGLVRLDPNLSTFEGIWAQPRMLDAIPLVPPLIDPTVSPSLVR